MVDHAKSVLANSQMEEWLTWSRHWRFSPGVTPFSQWYYQVIAVTSYFLIVAFLKRVMATRKPLEIPRFLFFHNAALCVASLVLAVWLTFTLVSRYISGLSFHGLVCSQSIYEDGHLHLIYYINMFFKVWEFLDTFLLALRKKPIGFLHAYHHAATLVLTWSQLVEHSGCQWVPIVINLWVHVFMYYYYAMSALRIRVWWKKYLTKLQISQFVVDVTIVTYAYATFIKAGFDPNVCYGTTRGALIGLGVLMSYLVLFVQFYFKTYTTPKTKGAGKQSRLKKSQ